jgi:hypothetical protein
MYAYGGGFDDPIQQLGIFSGMNCINRHSTTFNSSWLTGSRLSKN